MELSSRDFFKAAQQRFTTAELLLRHGHGLDAFYLSGYAVECASKALILHVVDDLDRPAMRDRITRGASMHHVENLAPILKHLGHPLPLESRKLWLRYKWGPELRYDHGQKNLGEVKGYQKLVARFLDWIEERLT
jgi:hypothetical protein